tara:strand:- start:15632 stop:16141 length:510 start_codon:yes stop_codon:yes gene_type:complete
MMLHLRNSNGYQNVISLDVYSRRYANTISNFGIENIYTRQYTPKFNGEYKTTEYYIELIDQLTKKAYLGRLIERIGGFKNYYPRAKTFLLTLDDLPVDGHMETSGQGMYNYNVYVTSGEITSVTDSKVIGIVTNGLALIHNDNWTSDSYQNSKAGMTPTTIPTTISYNG